MDAAVLGSVLSLMLTAACETRLLAIAPTKQTRRRSNGVYSLTLARLCVRPGLHGTCLPLPPSQPSNEPRAPRACRGAQAVLRGSAEKNKNTHHTKFTYVVVDLVVLGVVLWNTGDDVNVNVLQVQIVEEVSTNRNRSPNLLEQSALRLDHPEDIKKHKAHTVKY